MKRVWPYLIIFATAVIVAVLPAAIYADLLTPFSEWENWYWLGQPHPRPYFTGTNQPPILRAEVRVYKVLVIPPGWIKGRLTGYATIYHQRGSSRA
jgi:hypothetical protein